MEVNDQSAFPDRRWPDLNCLRMAWLLANRDAATRARALDEIANCVDRLSAGHYGSPLQDQPLRPCNEVLAEWLPTFLRLAKQCPFSDVRKRLSALLSDLKDRGIRIPYVVSQSPSSFIPEVVSLEKSSEGEHDSAEPVECNCQMDATAESVLETVFLDRCRVDHLALTTAFHPKYLEYFHQTQQFLMQGDGPLKYEHRPLIAIMAAARHQCTTLIYQEEIEYLQQDCGESALGGLKFMEEKLRSLNELNRVLAHRPWHLTEEHIEALTKPAAGSWSLSEIVHAIMIMAHFHALSGFVFACGINPEVDHPSGHSFDRPPSPVPSEMNGNTNGDSLHEESSAGGVEQSVQELMATMKDLREVEHSHEEMLKNWTSILVDSLKLGSPATVQAQRDQVRRYVDDEEVLESWPWSNPPPMFRAQEYSWDEHGFSLANRLYNGSGDVLDEKFRFAYNMTYNTMADYVGVDTKLFRRAIWKCMQLLFGIFQDDFNYDSIKRLLSPPVIHYIVKFAFTPEDITKENYDSTMRELKHSEKVHVNIMLYEARFQVELVYALRAITRFMTSKSF